ncbi:hypothetical protein QUF58_02500 [Anaerolineales bacterium HSG24]|nr:hypothetical protein [Anaerolineales bacterium HSG24]
MMGLFGRKSKKDDDAVTAIPPVKNKTEAKPTLGQRLNPFKRKKTTPPVQTEIVEVEKKPATFRRKILVWVLVAILLIMMIVGGPLVYELLYQPAVVAVAQFRVNQVATSTAGFQDFSATSTREALLIAIQVETAEAYQTRVMQEAQSIAKVADQQTREAFEQLVVAAHREVDGTATAAAQEREGTAMHNANLFTEAEAVRVTDAAQQDKNVTVAAGARATMVQQKNPNPNDCTQPAVIFILAFGAIIFRQPREI